MAKKGKGKMQVLQSTEIAAVRVANPLAYAVPDVEHKRGVTTYREPSVKASVSLRDDPLGLMYARRQIGPALYRAGREYQATREAMGIGAGRSASDLKEHVDGGQIASDGITDRQISAGKKLEALRRRLGDDGYRLLEAVLIDKRTIREIADASPMMSGKAATTFYGHLFRRHLAVAAKAWGFAS